MPSSIIQPIQTNQRLVIIDVLRGWAILGVVIMNYLDFFGFERDWGLLKTDGLNSGLFTVVITLFAGKSWTLLSVLFGYGFAMLMDRLQQKSIHPYRFFIGRMFWLFVLAIFNSALFFGDILKDYAVLGLVMLLFHRTPVRITFVFSLILLSALPFVAAYVNTINDAEWDSMSTLYPLYQSKSLVEVFSFGLKGTYIGQVLSKPYLYTVHLVMLICMLWGKFLYQIKFFEDLATKLKYIKETFWIALMALIGWKVLLSYVQKHHKGVLHHFDLRYLIIISAMLLITSIILWLFLSVKSKSFFNQLAFMGRMTLTNYMVQNLVGLIVFSGAGFGIWNTKPLWFYLLLSVGVYVLQVYFSKWWLNKYNYGPIEWIWRQLSYGKWLPLKKQY